MDIIDSIVNLTNSISNRFGMLLNSISSFFNSIINLLSYIFEILKAIWFGLTSLLGGVLDLLNQVISGDLVVNILKAYEYISNYIGTFPTLFIASMLLIAMLRIGIAFVFKIFRLNLDYHETYNKNRTYEQHAKLDSMKGSFF